MKTICAVGVVLMLGASIRGQTALYVQPLDPAGGLHKSAWYPPDGLDSDIYCWDAFRLTADGTITEVRWMGAYSNFLGGAGKAPVHDFTVSIWESGLGGMNPNIVGQPLVEYDVGSNAGETPAGVSIMVSVPGGPSGWTPLYNYSFVLPQPFHAAANTKYWVEIVAWQGLTPQYYWPPDWGLPGATGLDGSHFRRINDGAQYQTISHDLAFSLLGPSCYPDCNADGTLTVADFGCFQTKFVAADPYADCNADGSLTVADFGCFQTGFVTGCP